MRVVATTLFVLSVVFSPLKAAQRGNAVCDVKQYGAVADGKTLDSGAINKAIEACSASGGGTVFLPAGIYVSGTVYLKSNITLYLDSGATLLGSKNIEDYKLIGTVGPAPIGRPVRVFVFGEGLTNVAIEGHGTIDGNKVYNEQLFREKTRVIRPEQMPGWFGTEVNRGPHAVVLTNCTRVRIEDIQVKDSSNFAFRVQSCRDLSIRGVTVHAGWDGFNINNSRFVTISDCNLQTGDDAFAGGGDEYVLISNCLLNSSCNAFRLGVNKHFKIVNCTIYSPGVYEHRTSHRHATLIGILIEVLGRPRPGSSAAARSIEDIMISNVSMQNVRCPFHISTLGTGVAMRDIFLSNIDVTGGGEESGVIRGDGKLPISDVTLSNVRITTVGGVTEPNFSSAAYGIECSNIKNLNVHDVAIQYEKADRRPALICDNVDKLVLENFQSKNPSEGNPPIELKEIRDVEARAFTPVYKGLRLNGQSENGRPVVGQTFKATVLVEGSKRDGLHRVDLQLGTETYSQWAWLRAGESKEVVFADLKCSEPGTLELAAGQFDRKLSVQPRPQGPNFILSDVRVPNFTLPPLSVSALVSNIGAEGGTHAVSLDVDGAVKTSEQVELPSGDSKQVALKVADLSPGKHEFRIGNSFPATIQIPGAVSPPYSVAGDGNCCYEFGGQNHFYVLAPRTRYEIADEYHAVFLARGLESEGVATVKIGNPSRLGTWWGRVGLIVRNAMADPKSGGYLVLASSASHGWSLQWDEDGDGMLDHHTDFDGYSVWPSWLKLIRRGDTFTGFYSTDHLHWMQVGSATLTGARAQLDVGMFAAAMTGEFSEFALQSGANEFHPSSGGR
jgi:Glycosyl hydrolases family 28